jgi:hypothetical protein
MPWLLSKSKTGRKFSWETVKDALAAVTAGTQARFDTSSLYTNISGLWGMGTTPPPGGATTGVTAGTPGSFTGAVPANLAALQALGALGSTTAWTVGQSVALGDSSTAYWGGVAWIAGVAPAAGTTTGATSGSPGAFVGAIPATLAALQALGALGNTTAWKDRRIGQLQEWVRTANADLAVWGGPGTGTGKGWVAVTPAQIDLDVTALITGGASGWPSGTTPANLAALKANGQAGDGKGYQADGTFGTGTTGGTKGVAFATGQFVTLGDGSKASYNGTIWSAGAA